MTSWKMAPLVEANRTTNAVIVVVNLSKTLSGNDVNLTTVPWLTACCWENSASRHCSCTLIVPLLVTTVCQCLLRQGATSSPSDCQTQSSIKCANRWIVVVCRWQRQQAVGLASVGCSDSWDCRLSYWRSFKGLCFSPVAIDARGISAMCCDLQRFAVSWGTVAAVCKPVAKVLRVG